MNFLSHYYFERTSENENMVMGVVLPDFIKNANKDWNLYPQKEEHLFADDDRLAALLSGWKRHLEVDRLFHSSVYFSAQTAILKQMITPLLHDSPVKPFFLAHIGLELVLDHLLVIQRVVDISAFYEQISKANSPSLSLFLSKAGLRKQDEFFRFLDSFISSRYLLSYQKIENITYALNRICMRIWPAPLTEKQLAALTEKLIRFTEILEPGYLTVFNDIEKHLTTFE